MDVEKKSQSDSRDKVLIFSIMYSSCGPGSVVGIATAYGMDGLGIESRWGRDFPHLSTQPPVKWVPGFPEGKVRPGRDADPSPPSRAEVKNRVELYLCSPYGPSRPMKG